MLKREKIATLCLTIGTFANPAGFDAVVLTAMKLTGGYWNAMLLLYCLVGLFATLYFFYRKNIFLMLALFVNPFGYDSLFAWTMKETGSFMAADLIFYGIAIIFFIAYFHLSRTNPVKYMIYVFKSFNMKVRSLF